MSDTVRCCVVGGGPAGMMLGVLLARAGVEVTVLEKHADFLRDFRGDTIHPSTLSILDELGLLQEFLTLPHREVHELRMQLGNTVIPIGDFSHLSAPCRFVALMRSSSRVPIGAILAWRPMPAASMANPNFGLISPPGRRGSAG